VKLTESLAEVGHVAEVSRVLLAFRSRHGRSVGQRELTEIANRTAGAGYRYPNPAPALTLAQDLGLTIRRRGLVRLTGVGEKFVQTGTDDPLSLTVSQSKMIFGILLDDKDFGKSVSSMFRRLHDDGTGRLAVHIASLSGDQDIVQCATVLQQLAVFSYADGSLYLSKEYEPMLSGWLGTASLDETTLWAKLDAQRERAKIAEEFVLERERERLTELGRSDLADLVFRTSEVNVYAGFDIESFEADASRRYIEVKSSVGVKIRFEWSILERETAQELGNRYWVYFIPMAHLLPTLNGIFLIRNPIAHMESRALSEMPTAFLVRETVVQKNLIRHEAEERIEKGRVRLIEWKPALHPSFKRRAGPRT